MESARAQYVVDRVDAGGYEPDVIDGAQVGESRDRRLQRISVFAAVVTSPVAVPPGNDYHSSRRGDRACAATP
jgi:hypothetical protein